MNVVIHDCRWLTPHAPHTSPVVHPTAPTIVTVLSCPGTPVPVSAAAERYIHEEHKPGEWCLTVRGDTITVLRDGTCAEHQTEEPHDPHDP